MRLSMLTALRGRCAAQSQHSVPLPRGIPRIAWSRQLHCPQLHLRAHSSIASPPASPATASGSQTLPDHRSIAAAQDLFITHPTSPGSPLFLPHGARIFNKLVAFIRSQYALYGYDEVITPTIYKRSLWETSGHWENYKEHMFEVAGRGESGAKDKSVEPEEGQEEYGLKPMNCPGHCLLFKHASGKLSLRDLPVRYADFAPLHRNEVSGSLSGLTRVRRFHQDDAHIFCRPSQIAQEISSTLQFIDTVYKVFRLPSYKLVLSTRPEEGYIGSKEEWDRAEAALKQSLSGSGQAWTINEGDGAFYGPKIDITLADPDGKEHQTATIQLDFQLPRRFGLNYHAPAPAAEQMGISSSDPEELKVSGLVTPVIIHRAILGSLERFMALLIEYYNGRWPFWISPRQAIVIPVAMTDEIVAYSKRIQERVSGLSQEHPGSRGDENRPLPMSRRTFSVDLDATSNSLSKKIKAAKSKHYNHIIVVGERNVRDETVSVDSASSRGRIQGVEGKGEVKEMTVDEVYRKFVRMEDGYE